MSNETAPLAVNTEEACKLVGLGRNSLLHLAYTGAIPSFKAGRRRLFPVEGLQEWVRQETEKAKK